MPKLSSETILDIICLFDVETGCLAASSHTHARTHRRTHARTHARKHTHTHTYTQPNIHLMHYSKVLDVTPTFRYYEQVKVKLTFCL